MHGSLRGVSFRRLRGVAAFRRRQPRVPERTADRRWPWACAILFMFTVSTLPAQVALRPIAAVTKNPRVQKALAKLGADVQATTDEQIRITEIPAPTFHEAARGAYVAKLLAAAGLNVSTDSAGNVV